MARWIEILTQFIFKIVHRSGKKHLNADSLSRIPCDPDDCNCYDGQTILTELPCGGCDKCQKKHKMWSDFSEMDGVNTVNARCIHYIIEESEEDPTILEHQVQKSAECETSSSIIKPILTVKHQACDDNLPHHALCADIVTTQGSTDLGDKDGETTDYLMITTRSVRPVKQGKEEGNTNQTTEESHQDCNTRSTWIEGYTYTTLKKMQVEDPDLEPIVTSLSKGPVRPHRELIHDKSPACRNLWLLWDQLRLVEGVLFKQYIETGSKETKLLLVVPRQLQGEIVHSAHNPVTSGHLGTKKTLSKIKRSFYWYKMKDTVHVWVKKCASCGARKRPNKTPKAAMKEYRVGAPMDRVCIDVCGPFPISDQGNKYILVVGDSFTRWIEAYAMPDQTAKTIAEKLTKEFFSRFGLPLEIHSDQGRSFESDLFQQLCKVLDIHKTRTSSYHPIGNSMIERFNYTLVTLISAYVDEEQRQWDIHLPLLTSAYRSCLHEATGFSPNMLMLGREINAPMDLMYGPIFHEPEVDPCQPNESEYVANHTDRMQRIYKLVRENLAKTGERQKKDYDARLSQNTYSVGDLVYHLDSTKQKGKSPKLNPHKWIGPCIITKKYSDLLFEICVKQRGRRRLLHHNRLKPYHSEEIPQWILKFRHDLQLKEKQPETDEVEDTVDQDVHVPGERRNLVSRITT